MHNLGPFAPNFTVALTTPDTWSKSSNAIGLVHFAPMKIFQKEPYQTFLID